MTSRLLSLGVVVFSLVRDVAVVRGNPLLRKRDETQPVLYESREVNIEDAYFWGRFLQQESSLTSIPTASPTYAPSNLPTPNPTAGPTQIPTPQPTSALTAEPTAVPTYPPTVMPAVVPTATQKPSDSPSIVPSNIPSSNPTESLPLLTPSPSTAPSAAPVTAAPVTAAPVTAAPVTAAPVTAAPVTAAPVTAAPVTAAPVTAAPVTAAPVTASPVTAPPVTAAPVTPAPVTAAPVTKAPVTTAPVTAVPTTAAPITAAPVTAAPITRAPVTEAPVTNAPVTTKPTSRPTFKPVLPTTPLPTRLPTPKPTYSCTIDVALDCAVGGGYFGGQNCNSSSVGASNCNGTLKSMTMLYTGEKCTTSINQQNASCTDLTDAPLPIRAYIVVADNGGLATYFQDWVIIGSTYDILPLANTATFSTMQRIQVYNSSSTVDANLAQEVLYESDCRVPLGLSDQFGASQLVEFQTTRQGNVSSYVNFIFDVSLSLPSTFPDVTSTLNRLIVISNAAGNVNLTGSVFGKQLAPMKFINVSLPPIPIDLTTRLRYNTLATVAGVSNPSGLKCDGQAFSTFVAGGQSPSPSPQ